MRRLTEALDDALRTRAAVLYAHRVDRMLEPAEHVIYDAVRDHLLAQRDAVLRALGRERHRFPLGEPLGIAEGRTAYAPLTRRARDLLAVLWGSGSSVTAQQRTAERIAKGMLAAYGAGLDEVERTFDVGLTFDARNRLAVRYMGAYGAGKGTRAYAAVSRIDETTRDAMSRLLAQATAEGWSYEETAQQIAARFETWGGPQWAWTAPRPQAHIRSRAELVATTEARFAFSNATHDVARLLQDSGLRMRKRWVPVPEPNVCEYCEANAGEDWIPLDQPFASGDDFPPAHPACRCFEETDVDPQSLGVPGDWSRGDGLREVPPDIAAALSRNGVTVRGLGAAGQPAQAQPALAAPAAPAPAAPSPPTVWDEEAVAEAISRAMDDIAPRLDASMTALAGDDWLMRPSQGLADAARDAALRFAMSADAEAAAEVETMLGHALMWRSATLLYDYMGASHAGFLDLSTDLWTQVMEVADKVAAIGTGLDAEAVMSMLTRAAREVLLDVGESLAARLAQVAAEVERLDAVGYAALVHGVEQSPVADLLTCLRTGDEAAADALLRLTRVHEIARAAQHPGYFDEKLGGTVNAVYRDIVERLASYDASLSVAEAMFGEEMAASPQAAVRWAEVVWDRMRDRLGVRPWVVVEEFAGDSSMYDVFAAAMLRHEEIVWLHRRLSSPMAREFLDAADEALARWVAEYEERRDVAGLFEAVVAGRDPRAARAHWTTFLARHEALVRQAHLTDLTAPERAAVEALRRVYATGDSRVRDLVQEAVEKASLARARIKVGQDVTVAKEHVRLWLRMVRRSGILREMSLDDHEVLAVLLSPRQYSRVAYEVHEGLMAARAQAAGSVEEAVEAWVRQYADEWAFRMLAGDWTGLGAVDDAEWFSGPMLPDRVAKRLRRFVTDRSVAYDELGGFLFLRKGLGYTADEVDRIWALIEPLTRVRSDEQFWAALGDRLAAHFGERDMVAAYREWQVAQFRKAVEAGLLDRDAMTAAVRYRMPTSDYTDESIGWLREWMHDAASRADEGDSLVDLALRDPDMQRLRARWYEIGGHAEGVDVEAAFRRVFGDHFLGDEELRRVSKRVVNTMLSWTYAAAERGEFGDHIARLARAVLAEIDAVHPLMRERVLSTYIQTWAFSSDNQVALSDLVQLAAKVEFGMTETAATRGLRGWRWQEWLNTISRESKWDQPLNVGVRRRICAAVGAEVDRDGLLLPERLFTRLQYIVTQGRLAAAGIRRVPLMRGFDAPRSLFGLRKTVDMATKVGTCTLNPLSSFSFRVETASSFASPQWNTVGCVLFSAVPRERIMSTALTGFGCHNEQELLVLGGRYTWAMTIGTRDTGWAGRGYTKPETFRALREYLLGLL